MDTSIFGKAVAHVGPMASIHLDVTRNDPAAAREAPLRWTALRDRLAAQGAPGHLIDEAAELVTAPTGAAGEQGRSLIIAESGVLLDQVLPHRPLHDSANYGRAPHLLPAARGLAQDVAHLLVRADHRGAEVSSARRVNDVANSKVEVDGGHDELHKFGGGGIDQRRFQMRAEDSWERNAEAVAREVDRMVEAHAPQLIVLTGDPHAKALLRRSLGRRASGMVVEVDGPGRAGGASEDALAARVEGVLTEFRLRAMGDVLARFEEQAGKGGGASGLAAVVAALRGGSVDTLLLHDDPSSTLELYAGDDSLQLGVTADEVRALGDDAPFADRADAILLRALVAQGGQLELVGGESVVRDGVGAIARFDTRPPIPG